MSTLQFQQNLVSVGEIIEAKHQSYPDRQFRVLNLLFIGGEGEVYQAEPLNWVENINCQFALKIPFNWQSETEKQFNHNLMVYQAGFETPQEDGTQIVKIYDIFEWQEKQIIVMELGEENIQQILCQLSQKEKQDRMSIKEQISILIQLSRSIKFLHDNNFIHCDIKPENFVKFGNEFKLIDFGKVTKEEEKQIIIGTEEFTPPEILTQSAYCTTKTDIWSLGATFFEILTQKSFNRQDVEQNNYQIISVENLSEEIEMKYKQLLQKMLHKNSQLRIDIGSVIQQLELIQIEIDQPLLLMTLRQDIINTKKELLNQFNDFENIVDQKFEQIKQEQQRTMNSQNIQKNKEMIVLDSGQIFNSQAITEDNFKSQQIIDYNEIVQDIKNIKQNQQALELLLKNSDLKSANQQIQKLSLQLNQLQQQIIDLQNSKKLGLQEKKQLLLKEKNQIPVIRDRKFSTKMDFKNKILNKIRFYNPNNVKREKQFTEQHCQQKILSSPKQQNLFQNIQMIKKQFQQNQNNTHQRNQTQCFNPPDNKNRIIPGAHKLNTPQSSHSVQKKNYQSFSCSSKNDKARK